MIDALRILIVTDGAADSAQIERQLRRQLIIDCCECVGGEAPPSEMLGQRGWHAVLLDYEMGSRGAHRMLADLRSAARDLPLIVVGGHIGEEELSDLFALGADDFVLKERLSRLGPVIDRCARLGAERHRRQLAEQALRDHDERLRMALLAAAMNAYEYDPASDEVRRTGGLSPILGLPEIGTGRDFNALIHPDDVHGFVETLLDLAPQHPSFHCEYRIRAPDGRYHWIADIGAAKFDEQGQITKIAGIRQDVTARKESEVALQQAAAVFASTQEGVAITDLQGNILRANPAFTTITEYEEAEYLGRNIRLLASGRHDRAFYDALWSGLRSAGYWQGQIWNRRKSGEIYPEWLTVSTVRDAAGTATGYVSVLTDISRIRHAPTDLERLAHHDALTDLPNRVLLKSRLDHTLNRARRNGGECAVLFVDLDHFKPVNDRFGHLAGDELLQQAAKRLSRRLREVDTLARWGGDEFVAVVEDIGDAATAGLLAGELIDLLKPPFPLSNGHRASIGASIGVSLFPYHGEAAEQLLGRADEALYMAKGSGRNRYSIYGANVARPE